MHRCHYVSFHRGNGRSWAEDEGEYHGQTRGSNAPEVHRFLRLKCSNRPGAGAESTPLTGHESTLIDESQELAVALNCAVEHGRNELGPEVLRAISREFGRSLEWLLTGEE